MASGRGIVWAQERSSPDQARSSIWRGPPTPTKTDGMAEGWKFMAVPFLWLKLRFISANRLSARRLAGIRAYGHTGIRQARRDFSLAVG